MRFALLMLAGLSLLTACRHARGTQVALPPPFAVRAAPPPTPTAAPASSAADEAILEALRTKRVKNLEWSEETTLPDAISYLRTITGLNFYVTPRAQTEREEVRIPLYVDDASVVDVLNLITSQNRMMWEVRDGLVRIATAEEVGSHFLLRYYDINDFVEAPSFAGTPGPPPASEPEQDAGVPTRGQLLVASIRVLIDPEEWSREVAILESKKGVLIVRAPASTHVKVQSYLDGLRSSLSPPLQSMERR